MFFPFDVEQLSAYELVPGKTIQNENVESLIPNFFSETTIGCFSLGSVLEFEALETPKQREPPWAGGTCGPQIV